jgi:hypothetical protein
MVYVSIIQAASLLLTGLQKKAHVYETFMSFELEENYLKNNHKVNWMVPQKEK